MHIMGINIIDLLFLVIFSSFNLGVLLSVFGLSHDADKESDKAMNAEKPYDIKDDESKTGGKLNDK